jgi:phenylacetate-coenzyme A ligase PaaK-like adenylate-forming protein
MEDKIFSVTEADFEAVALEIFHFQYHSNPVYQSWVTTLGLDSTGINTLEKIPFLPISFFKTHEVVTTAFKPSAVFESSGTTGMQKSVHYVKSMDVYQKSFLQGFEHFYGNPDQYAILGLLPSYLERKNSSLIVMVDALIKRSKNKRSGFYLNDHEKLQQELFHLSKLQQPALLIGVTFALLDFAETRQLQLDQTIIMETGGMKGRRDELTRSEVHAILKKRLGVPVVHSEYGMTELLSQAYASKNGIFQTPPWMKILIRDEEDPFSIKSPGSQKTTKGALNIIDLANLYSCSFIATDDLGSISAEGFTVDGRLDRSELRGCSLLTLPGF